jgi:importin-5
MMYIYQPSEETTDESYAQIYEQSLDRLACALGGKAVLQPAFQYSQVTIGDYGTRDLWRSVQFGEATSKVRGLIS